MSTEYVDAGSDDDDDGDDGVDDYSVICVGIADKVPHTVISNLVAHIPIFARGILISIVMPAIWLSETTTFSCNFKYVLLIN